MSDDVLDSFALGNAPTARRLPRADLKRPSSIWGLTPADPWRLRQARRHFIEARADDFVKEERDFVDRATGRRYRLERSDPTLGEDPKVSGVEVFYADDGWIAYLKPVGSVGHSKSSEIGERRRAAGVVSDYEYAKKLEDISRRKGRFLIPRSMWDERDWREHRREQRRQRHPSAGIGLEIPVIPPRSLPPGFGGLYGRPTPTDGARAVDQILGRRR